MTKTETAEPVRRRTPTHPGEVWLEIIEDHAKISVADAASRMGVSRQSLNEVLRARARVTPEMSERFAAVFGGVPELWSKMQLARDTYTARLRLKNILPKLSKIKYSDAA